MAKRLFLNPDDMWARVENGELLYTPIIVVSDESHTHIYLSGQTPRLPNGDVVAKTMREQLRQMANLGGMENMLEKLPGMNQLPPSAQAGMDPGRMRRMEAIIDSMTPQERRYPEILNGSRKRRISLGSGTRIQEVNRLLKEHRQMQRTMKKVTRKGGMQKMMRALNAQGQAQRPAGRGRRRR